jgi:cell division protein FtsN
MLKKLFNIVVIILISSCANKENQIPTIRLVSVDGKPSTIQPKTPSFNAKILQKNQNESLPELEDDKIKKVASTKVVGKNELKQETTPLEEKKETSQNNQSKIAKNTANKASDLNSQNSKINNEINYDLSQKSDLSQKNSLNLESKNVVQNNVIAEPFQKKLTKNDSETRIMFKNRYVLTPLDQHKVKNNKATSDKGKIFIQTGSFSTIAYATKSLNSNKKFFNNGKIEESLDGKVHKVLIGPLKTRQQALKIIEKIKKTGQDAIMLE